MYNCPRYCFTHAIYLLYSIHGCELSDAVNCNGGNSAREYIIMFVILSTKMVGSLLATWYTLISFIKLRRLMSSWQKWDKIRDKSWQSRPHGKAFTTSKPKLTIRHFCSIHSERHTLHWMHPSSSSHSILGFYFYITWGVLQCISCVLTTEISNMERSHFTYWSHRCKFAFIGPFLSLEHYE